MRGSHFLLVLLAAILLPICYSAWTSEQLLQGYREHGIHVSATVVDKLETNRRGEVRLLICEYLDPTSGRTLRGEFSWGTQAWESAHAGDHLDLVTVPGGHPIPADDLEARPWLGACLACGLGAALYLLIGFIARQQPGLR